jgi:hypothetical protein
LIFESVEAETPEPRDQLLDLARVWTEAALREEMNAKASGMAVAQTQAARHG